MAIKNIFQFHLINRILFVRTVTLLSFITLSFPVSSAQPASSSMPLIYLRPNETPMFTELYQRYGLLNPPALHVYDSSLYLGQTGKKNLLTPSSEAFFKDVEQTVKSYHQRTKSLSLFYDPVTKPYFCTSNGSLQIIFALPYAIANSDPEKKFLFVEKIPYYSYHEHAISSRPYANARFQGFHKASDIIPKNGEILVEYVTSPNNPDGKFRKPYTDASIIIADFVFASSSFGSDGSGYIKENLAWVNEARAQGKHVFVFNSVSKALGKPGFRLGYMWYPMADIYAARIFPKFFPYLWKLTVGSSTPGVADALNLMSAIKELPDAGQSLRTDVFNTIVKRHHLVERQLLKRYPGTQVTSIAGSPTLFAKLKSNNRGTGEEVLLKDLNVAVDNGNTMGATDDYVRINLCGASGDLANFLNRLARSERFSADELLLSSANHCTKNTIHSSEKPQYVANPNDCNILADAKDAAVEIILPQFINYQSGNITIKKIDSSNHTVTIKTKKRTLVLRKKGEQLRAKWSQPLFLDGHWLIK